MAHCACSQELRRVLLTPKPESWQPLCDALDELCAFSIPDERFCCREAVCKSGGVRAIIAALLAGGWAGQKRKRSHRDPPPTARDEMASKAANALGVICAPRQSSASRAASALLEQPSSAGAAASSSSSSSSTSVSLAPLSLSPRPPALDTHAADDASELCSWLYEHEDGAAIVNGLLDLIEQVSPFPQADALFALSWFLHIDAAERIALRRGVIPRVARLLADQSDAIRTGARVSEAHESVRVFALVCLARLCRCERETETALSPTAHNAYLARVQAERDRQERERAAAALQAAREAAAAEERRVAALTPRSRRAHTKQLAEASAVAATSTASSLSSSTTASVTFAAPTSESALPSSLDSLTLSAKSPSSSSSESRDARCHRLQHELHASLATLVPVLLTLIAHARAHHTVLLAYDVCAALVACEPRAQPHVGTCAWQQEQQAGVQSADEQSRAARAADVGAIDLTPCRTGVSFRPHLFHLLFAARGVYVIAAHKSHTLPSIAALARFMLESMLSDEARAHSRVPMECEVCAPFAGKRATTESHQ